MSNNTKDCSAATIAFTALEVGSNRTGGEGLATNRAFEKVEANVVSFPGSSMLPSGAIFVAFSGCAIAALH